MRVRKILNFYLDEPSHVDLLDYLDGIEGDTRRQQALVQMALIGYRVMVKHESGNESFFRARNPDVSRLLGSHPSELLEGGAGSVRRKPTRKSRKLIEATVEPVSSKGSHENAGQAPHTYQQSQPGIVVGRDALSNDERPVTTQTTSKGVPEHQSSPTVTLVDDKPNSSEDEFMDPLSLLKSLTD